MKILNECIENARREAVACASAARTGLLDLRDCTVIASPCFYAGATAVGSIGVVGPTRIEYDRLISIVDYIAKLFERVLDPENAADESRRDALRDVEWK